MTLRMIQVTAASCVAASIGAFLLARFLTRPIRALLKDMKHVVEIPEDIRVRAKEAIDAMLALPKPRVLPKFRIGAAEVPVELI